MENKIVYCKNCKYNAYGNYCVRNKMVVSGDDFCSKGEADRSILTCSDKIKHVRRSKNIRSKDVAKYVEMDGGSYSKLENSGCDRTFKRLLLISEFLNVPVTNLIGDEFLNIISKELNQEVEE